MRHAAKAAGRRALRGDRAARGARVSPAAHRPAAGGPGWRRRLRQLPYALVLGGIGLGLLTVHGGERVGVARLVLPEGRAGMLGSRRRLADVAILAALGVGILVAGLILPAPA